MAETASREGIGASFSETCLSERIIKLFLLSTAFSADSHSFFKADSRPFPPEFALNTI